ncbi:MAG: hypothetical protein IT545_15445 [Rhodobacteraceae bacterium]|nr:hypothetical protein [Paracoccaceae bacterium]
MTIDWGKRESAGERAAGELARARAAAAAGLVGAIEAAAEAATGRVPLAERLSWPAKEAAARAILAGAATAADLGLIAAEAAVTGEVPGDLALRIVGRAEALRTIAARLAGLRRRTLAEIGAAATAAAAAGVLAAARDGIAAAAAPP